MSGIWICTPTHFGLVFFRVYFKQHFISHIKSRKVKNVEGFFLTFSCQAGKRGTE